MLQDGKHGSAWGVLTWQGKEQQPDKPTQLNGPLKPVWRAEGSGEEQQQWQSLVAAALRQEQNAAKEAAAAGSEAAAAEKPAA